MVGSWIGNAFFGLGSMGDLLELSFEEIFRSKNKSHNNKKSQGDKEKAMNKMLVTLALVFGIIGLVAAKSFAEEVVKVGNKICPISGEAIGEGGMAGQQETVEYKGKAYNICCSMCKKDFLKDPEAAIKKMEEKEAEMK